MAEGGDWILTGFWGPILYFHGIFRLFIQFVIENNFVIFRISSLKCKYYSF